jgi:VanZ family protein
LNKPRINFILAITWFIIVTFLLCLPGSEFPKDDWLKKIQADKWVHIILYLALVITWCRAFAFIKNQTSGLNRIFIWVAVSGIIHGTVMEFIQHFFIPFRSFETGDILADSTGSLIGYFLARKYIKK